MTAKEKLADYFDFSGAPKQDYEFWETSIIAFAQEMCELQKKACAENAQIYQVMSMGHVMDTEVDQDSITSTKNVCED